MKKFIIIIGTNLLLFSEILLSSRDNKQEEGYLFEEKGKRGFIITPKEKVKDQEKGIVKVSKEEIFSLISKHFYLPKEDLVLQDYKTNLAGNEKITEASEVNLNISYKYYEEWKTCYRIISKNWDIRPIGIKMNSGGFKFPYKGSRDFEIQEYIWAGRHKEKFAKYFIPYEEIIKKEIKKDIWHIAYTYAFEDPDWLSYNHYYSKVYFESHARVLEVSFDNFTEAEQKNEKLFEEKLTNDFRHCPYEEYKDLMLVRGVKLVKTQAAFTESLAKLILKKAKEQGLSPHQRSLDSLREWRLENYGSAGLPPYVLEYKKQLLNTQNPKHPNYKRGHQNKDKNDD